jgi:hypothetical protein
VGDHVSNKRAALLAVLPWVPMSCPEESHVLEIVQLGGEVADRYLLVPRASQLKLATRLESKTVALHIIIGPAESKN